MLEVRNVTKVYDDRKVVNDATFDVKPGEIFALLGQNGAGKTTLIRMITDITRPDSGTITLDGQTVTSASRPRIAYLPEERGLYRKVSVLEALAYYGELKDLKPKDARRQAVELLEDVELAGWAKKQVHELSKGMQQKVQMCTALIGDPKLLILDEPFSGFDPINAELIRSEVLRMRDEGVTILLSTHSMPSVEEMCDHIALIDKSKVMLHGNVKEIRKRYSTNTYKLEFKGHKVAFADALAYHGEILEHKEEEGVTTVRVKLLHNARLNDVLGSTLRAVEFIGAHEEVPRMHDVFIRVVSENEPALVTSGMTE